MLVRVAAGAALGLSLIASVAYADTVPTPSTDAATTAATTTQPAPAPTTTSAPTTAPTTTQPGAGSTTPCVGAGAIAILQPGATAAVLGPSVAAVSPSGITAATVTVPSDGSLVALARLRAGAAGCRGDGRAAGGAATSLESLRLFGGAITAAAVSTDLVPATSADGSGWHVRASVAGLVVDGKPVRLARGDSLAVGDWAVIRVPARASTPATPLAYWAAAFEVVLRKPRAGYPAGTTLLVGYVSAAEPAAALPSSLRVHARRRHTARLRKTHNAKRHPHAQVPTSHPLKVTPPLKGSPYVFPVFGQVAFSDTYGAARSDVSGGWHHGDDIFAPLGTPILAVADGTVYSVGWNEVGGWRLWLRDRQGNRFYYAHLSGYTALARNGTHVKAGDVLAFVGNTGDAFTTPTHLHFEVHPVSLLRLGYDGAVDPTSYLDGWRRLDRIHVLRPVGLPPGAALDGKGAVTDYRKLLAVRALVPQRHRQSGRGEAQLALPPIGSGAVEASAPGSRHSGSIEPLLVSSLAALLAVLALAFRQPAVRAVVLARLRRRETSDEPPEAPVEENA